MLSGDVTEYGSREQLRLAKELLDGLKIPCHVIPGNHDTKWSESGATDFPRLWQEDRFVFEQGGFRFIGMHQGPLMKMGDGHWAPQDVRWLEETLKKLPDPNQPIIFITHYPIDDGIANWYVVLDLLKKYNTQVVLCGHGHANHASSSKASPASWAAPTCARAPRSAGSTSSKSRTARMTLSERAIGQQTKPPWHFGRAAETRLRQRHQPLPPPGFLGQRALSQGQGALDLRHRLHHRQHAGGLEGPGDRRRRLGQGLRPLPQIGQSAVDLQDPERRLFHPGRERRPRRLCLDGRKRLCAQSRERQRSLALHDRPAHRRLPAHRRGHGVHRFERRHTSAPWISPPANSAWQFDGLAGFVETKPLVYDGKVIFGAWDQYLYALDAKTGKLAWKWKGDKPGTLLSPAACWPVAANGKVFIVAPDRKMTALDARTGEQIWRTGAYVVRESIGLSQDQTRFYVRAMNDFFYAFSTAASHPDKVWELNAGFGYDINSAMLVEKDGVVFYGTKNDLLFALDAKTGAIKWEHKLGTGVMNTVVPLSSTQVLTTDFDGKVALVEAKP